MTLAFQESVNFLWRVLMGVCEAIPQYLVQAFKTGVQILDILTDASFWSIVGNAFVGVMRTAVNGILALLSEGIANLIEYIPGMGKQAAWMHGLSREFEKDADRGAAQVGGAAKSFIDSYGDRILRQVADNFSALQDAFSEGFSNAADVMDTSGIKAEMASISDRITGALENRMPPGRPRKKRTPPRASPGGKRLRTTRQNQSQLGNRAGRVPG